METVRTNTRIALNNILVTTDFSQASRLALPYAMALAQQYEGKVLVAHAVSPEPHLNLPLEPMPLDADTSGPDAERNLRNFTGELAGGARCQTVLERGELWNVISGIITKRNVDLVVAGTRGRLGLSKLVLGSNAEKIYRQSPCPVLTIGPNVPPLEGSTWKLNTILFPTDGSEVSGKALPYALSLAEENQATLIFLQLMPLIPPEYREFDDGMAREAMRALVPDEAWVWCSPEFVTRFVPPAQGILDLAQERAADLIVMGVKKSSESVMPGHSPWPVASQVVAEASCPVLTVRG